MILATFNTNSIRARLPIILDWLDRMKPDVLCLQETKAQDKDFPAAAFAKAGFECTFKGQKSYNGVALISKRPLEEICHHLPGEGDEEARFISATLHDIPVVNVYVPQGFAPGTEKFQYKLDWLSHLHAYIRGRYGPDTPLLLAGDFNVALEPIDVYDPDGLRGEVGFHPDEQSAMRRILDWGLVDILENMSREGATIHFGIIEYPTASNGIWGGA